MKVGIALIAAVWVVLPFCQATFIISGATTTVGAGWASLAVLGLIGAKVAAVAGGLLLLRARGRGKREAVSGVEIKAALENVFSEMVEENTASCFERLMCDMAADPNSDAYSQHLPMMVSVQAASTIQLDNSEASKVVEKLNAAIAFGESIAAFRGKGVLCEATYNKCPFTGEKMGFAIAEVEKIENAV